MLSTRAELFATLVVKSGAFIVLYNKIMAELEAQFQKLHTLYQDDILDQLMTDDLKAGVAVYAQYMRNPSQETKAAANNVILALSKKKNNFSERLTTIFPPGGKTPSLQPLKDALAEMERLARIDVPDYRFQEIEEAMTHITMLRSSFIKHKNDLINRSIRIGTTIQNLVNGLIQLNTTVAPTIQSQLEQELKQMEAERSELAAVQNAPALNEVNLGQLRARIQQNGSTPQLQSGPIPPAQVNTPPSASVVTTSSGSSPSSNRTGQTPPPVQPAASSSSSSAVVLVAVGGAKENGSNGDNGSRSRNNTPPSREHTPPSKKNQVVPSNIQLDIVPPADPNARASHQGLNGKRELEEQQRIAAEAPAKKPVQKKWYHCCS